MPTRLGRGFLWFCRTHIAGAIAIDKTHCILSHFGVLWLHAFLDACLGSVCHWLVLTHSSHKRVFVEMKKKRKRKRKEKRRKKVKAVSFFVFFIPKKNLFPITFTLLTNLNERLCAERHQSAPPKKRTTHGECCTCGCKSSGSRNIAFRVSVHSLSLSEPGPFVSCCRHHTRLQHLFPRPPQRAFPQGFVSRSFLFHCCVCVFHGMCWYRMGDGHWDCRDVDALQHSCAGWRWRASQVSQEPAHHLG